jgi:D-serine dehydratase
VVVFCAIFVKAFPETAKTNGYLESSLTEIQAMKSLLIKESTKIEKRFFLKCDNSLPITGSIKARGGFFEVFHYAEELALKANLLKGMMITAFYQRILLEHISVSTPLALALQET